MYKKVFKKSSKIIPIADDFTDFKLESKLSLDANNGGFRQSKSTGASDVAMRRMASQQLSQVKKAAFDDNSSNSSRRTTNSGRLPSIRYSNDLNDVFASISSVHAGSLSFVYPLYIGFLIIAILYMAYSIPYRIGFLHDPYVRFFNSDRKLHHDYTVFIILDILVDICFALPWLFSVLDVFKKKDGWVGNVGNLVHAWWHCESSMIKKSTKRVWSRSRASIIETRAKIRMEMKKKKAMRAMHQSEGRNVSDANRTIGSITNFYTTSWYLENVLSLPFDWICLLLFNSSWYKVIRIVKLGRMLMFNSLLYELYQHYHKIRSIYLQSRGEYHTEMKIGATRMLALFHLLFWCGHFCACAFMFIAKLECGYKFEFCLDSDTRTSWAVQDHLHLSQEFRMYVRSLYWAMVTLVTVGYGDIVPVTKYEMWFVCIVELLGALLSSTIIAAFSFMISTKNARYAEFTGKMEMTQLYLKSRNVPEKLVHRVSSYFKYVWTSQKGVAEYQVMQELPEHFRTPCYYVLRARFLQDVCFLRQEALGFISKLAILLESSFYSPNDWVIESPDNLQSIHFVSHGEVSLLQFNGRTKKNVKVGTLSPGKCFGALTLFHLQRFKFKVLAETYCELFSFSSSEFHAAIRQYYVNDSDQHWQQMIKLALNYKPFEPRKCRHSAKTPRNSSGVFTSDTTKDFAWNEPGSNFLIVWNTIAFLLLITYTFVLPYQWCTGARVSEFEILTGPTDYPWEFTSELLVLCIDLFFVIDMVLKARCIAFVTTIAAGVRTFVHDPNLVFNHYRQKGMLFDAMCTFPIGLVVSIFYTGYHPLLHALRFLRLVRITKFTTLSTAFYQYFAIKSSWQDMLTSFFVVVTLLHWNGCYWFSFAWRYPDQIYSSTEIEFGACIKDALMFNNCTWGNYDGLMAHETNGALVYARAIYWAIVCITTVGYGDIRPISTLETAFVFGCVYVGGLLNYFIVGAVSYAVTNMISRTEKYNGLFAYMNRFLKLHNVPTKMRIGIKEYFVYQWSRKKGIDESVIMQALPCQLHEQVSSCINQRSVMAIPIFSHCHFSLVKAICTKFRQQVFQKDDYIIRAGDIANGLCIINRGRVEILLPSQSCPLSALEKGNYFAEVAFLTNAYHSVHVVARSFCDISMLMKEDFDDVIKEYPAQLTSILAEAQIAAAHYRKIAIAVSSNLHTSKMRSMLDQNITSFYTESPIPKGTISPTSTTYTIWMLWMVAVGSYQAFAIVYRIAFLQDVDFDNIMLLSIVDFALDATLWLDIFLHYYIFGYLQDGEERLLRDEIQHHYLTTQFTRDLISVFPIYYLGKCVWAVHACRLVRLIKCIQLPANIRVLQDKVMDKYASAKVTSAFTLLNLLLILFTSAHYASCIFYLISYNSSDEAWIAVDSVILHIGDGVGGTFTRYLRSFYWGLGTLTLVVYGDIVPVNALETSFTILVCLAALFIMGQVIGRFTTLILRLDEDAYAFQALKDNFDTFATANDLSMPLVARAHNYFAFQYEKTKGLDTQIIMKQLPPSLRLILATELYKNIVFRQRIFGSLGTGGRIQSIAEHLKRRVYLPNDTIAQSKISGQGCFFIMKQGLADVIISNVEVNKLVVATIQDDTIFGEVGFFLHKFMVNRIATVKASTFCEVMIMNRSGWDSVFAGDKGMMAEKPIISQVKLQYEEYKRAHKNIVSNWKKSLEETRRIVGIETLERRRGKLQSWMINVEKKFTTTITGANGQRKSLFSRFLSGGSNLPRLTSSYAVRQSQQSGSELSDQEDDEIDDMKAFRQRQESKNRQSRRVASLIDIKPLTISYDRTAETMDPPTVMPILLRKSTPDRRKTLCDMAIELDGWLPTDLPIRRKTPEAVVMRTIDAISLRRSRSTGSLAINKKHREIAGGRTVLKTCVNESTSMHIRAKIYPDQNIAPAEFSMPDSIFRQLWNLLLISIAMYLSLVIPFRISFYFEKLVSSSGTYATACGHLNVVPLDPVALFFWYLLEYVMDLVSVIDIALNWSYFKCWSNGQIIIDKDEARKAYMAGKFKWDVAALVPFELLVPLVWLLYPEMFCTISFWQLLTLCRLNRFLRLVHVSKMMQMLEETLYSIPSLSFDVISYRFLQVVMMFLLAAHWVGCSWYVLGKYSNWDMDLPSWFKVSELESAGTITRYTKSVYFALTSLTTVGYGDIVSTNVYETLGQILVIVASVCVFGSLVAAQEIRIKRKYGDRDLFEQKVARISDFIKFRKLPMEMRVQILNYYDRLWLRQKGVDEISSIECLPRSLQYRIALHVKRDLLENVKLFDHCDMNFVKAMVHALKLEVFLPHVTIVKEGDIGRSMYFVRSGRISVYNNLRKYRMVMQKGEYFGEVSLIYDVPRSANCVAETICELYVLEYHRYEEILKEYPDYREKNRRAWVLSNTLMLERNKKLAGTLQGKAKTHMTFKQAARVVATISRLSQTSGTL